MTDIVFDIETIPSQLPGIREELAAAVQAPAQYKKADSIAQWLAENRGAEAEAAWLRTSFDGGLGQIVCIGWAIDGQEPRSVQVDGLGQEAEADMLRCWFAEIGPAYTGSHGTRPVLIGHNHIGFDIPFVWKRCMVHGIRPPAWFPRNPKPWADSVVDTMLLWDQTQRAGGSMDRLCRLLGIPGKGGISGADVWPMVKAGDIEGVARYCRDDVERTRALWRRMTFQQDEQAQQHLARAQAGLAKAA